MILSHPSILLAIALFIICVYALYLDHKIVVLTRGKSGASLEDTIKECLASVGRMEEENKAIIQHASLLDKKVSHALRNAEVIRYKAFDVSGSNQSFSIALLNELGNGVIITSLHLRDRVNTFAKPVKEYDSEYELTEEEIAVLEDAKGKHEKVISS